MAMTPIPLEDKDLSETSHTNLRSSYAQVLSFYEDNLLWIHLKVVKAF